MQCWFFFLESGKSKLCSLYSGNQSFAPYVPRDLKGFLLLSTSLRSNLGPHSHLRLKHRPNQLTELPFPAKDKCNAGFKATNLLYDGVVSQSSSSLVEFSIASLVNQFFDALQIGVAEFIGLHKQDESISKSTNDLKKSKEETKEQEKHTRM